MQAHDESLTLFSEQLVNKGLLHTQMIEHLPISQIGSGCIEFNVTPQNFIDLSRSYIYFKCKTVIDADTAITYVESLEKFDVKGDVAPCNCLLSTMFQKVDLSIQHRTVSSDIPTYCYPYKNYLDKILSVTSDEDMGIMFAKDASVSLNSCSQWKAVTNNKDNETPNPGLKKRAKVISRGQEFELQGPIGIDFMKQKRLLMHNTNIGLKFWPSTPEFSLLSSDLSQKFNIKILEAKLILCHVNLEPAVSTAISDALVLKPAHYPYINSKMRSQTVSKGSQVAIINDIFGNECPDQLYVCMVKSAAATGSFHENPFFLNHFNISEVGFYFNNISLPAKPLKLNFGESAYQSHYLEAYQRIQRQNPDWIVSYEEFYRGYTIFAFDLTNRENFEDLTPNTYTGNSKLELRFSKALEESIVVYMYGKFKSLLTIDAARNVVIQ